MVKGTADLKAEVIHKEIMNYISSEVSYIDAIVEYCGKHDLEIEVVASIIKKSPTLKGKVLEDAERLNMVEAEENKLL